MPNSIKPKRLRVVLRWVLWVLLFQFILINISASLHAWKQTHFYNDPALRIARPSSKNIFIKTWKLFSGLKFPRSILRQTPSFPVDSVHLTTAEGLNIEGWYSPTDSLSRGTVILFHAFGGNKSYILSEAAEFRYLGYNIMMIDFRGHGNSGGNMTTIGYRETEEAKLAYDYIQQKGEKTIFLWGVSMGAVVITKLLHDYPLAASGVILEMPVTSLQSFLEGRSRSMGFPEEPFGFLVTTWIGLERGFNGFDFKAAQYAKSIQCPVLLQWGTKDAYITREQINALYRNIPATHKRFVVYENADHQSLLGFDPLRWRLEVKAMLNNPAGLRDEGTESR